MIPGIAPVTVAKVGGGGSITGTITVGNTQNTLFGYNGPGSGSGFPTFGSISGDAAYYIYEYFAWAPSQLLFSLANAKNTTTAKLIFQGQTYGLIDGGGGAYYWPFGPEISTWPTSGTHTFEIIDP